MIEELFWLLRLAHNHKVWVTIQLLQIWAHHSRRPPLQWQCKHIWWHAVGWHLSSSITPAVSVSLPACGIHIFPLGIHTCCTYRQMAAASSIIHHNPLPYYAFCINPLFLQKWPHRLHGVAENEGKKNTSLMILLHAALTLLLYVTIWLHCKMGAVQYIDVYVEVRNVNDFK